MPELDDKEFYHDLTDKQARVVDEIVKDLSAQNTEIADRADVARSTVYNVKEHYGHIVDQQLDQRGRDKGEETTEGDLFAELSEHGVQHLSERPHQPDSDDADAEGATAITVSLTEAEVRDVLERDSCAPLRDQVLRRVIDRAF